MSGIFIFALIVAYSIEPVFWILSMRAVNRYNKPVHIVVASGVGYLVLSLGKQYATFCGVNRNIRGSILVLFWFYIITMTMILFRNKWKCKMLSLGIFLLLNLWSEQVSIICYILFFHGTAKQIVEVGLANVFCTIQAKILLAILCKSVFITKNSSKDIIFNNTDKLPLVMTGTVCEVILFAGFPLSIELIDNLPLLIGFVVLQSYIIFATGYVVWTAGKQHQKVEQLEREVKSYRRDRKLKEQCQQLRHDVSLYKHMLYRFLEEEQYEELRRYMEAIAQDLDGVSDEFELDDVTVMNTLNILAAKIRDEHIRFEHTIMVSDFILSSYDLSRILWNILMNAMEAVQRIDEGNRKIFLEIRPERGGYHINCMNSYGKGKDVGKDCYSTTKKDKKDHGNGLFIVKQIVEEYGGIMKFSIHPVLFELDCYIPEKER